MLDVDLRRHARLSRERLVDARDSAVHGSRHRAAEVHVGRSSCGSHETCHRRQGRPARRRCGAAASHTGRLASSDAEYTAAFRRAGMLRVASLDELFDAVETLAVAKLPRGKRLAIVTNGGGLGVLAVDELVDRGGELAVLSDETLARLDGVLPPTWSHGNPVDIVGDAPPERFAAALDVVLADGACDAIARAALPDRGLVGRCSGACRRELRASATRRRRSLRAGSASGRSSRARRADGRARADLRHARACGARVHASRRVSPQPRAAARKRRTRRRISRPTRTRSRRVRRGRRRGRAWLTPVEVRTVLAAYGIATVAGCASCDAGRSGARGRAHGRPVALKIVSPDLVHKSDVGGVALGLVGAASGRARGRADARADTRCGARREGGRIHRRAHGGSASEPRAHRGASSRGDFGPMLLFGEGGVAVEVVADTTLELLPLNLHARAAHGRAHARLPQDARLPQRAADRHRCGGAGVDARFAARSSIGRASRSSKSIRCLRRPTAASRSMRG